MMFSEATLDISVGSESKRELKRNITFILVKISGTIVIHSVPTFTTKNVGSEWIGYLLTKHYLKKLQRYKFISLGLEALNKILNF